LDEETAGNGEKGAIMKKWISIFMFLHLLSSNGYSWEGFDWETWRDIAKAEKIEAQSPQAGMSSLLPLLKSGGQASPDIDSIKDWETKRDSILQLLHRFIGQADDLQPLPPLAEQFGEVDCGTYLRRHIRIRSEADDWIPAYLLLPKPLPEAPTPVMIVLHQTVAQGKEEPCGIKGDTEKAFAVELARKGFICIAPDVIGFGERIPPGAQPYHGAHDFYRKHPRWSFFGKMIWDVQRIVDYLETLPQVDARRIGAIGHSHGAYGTIMSAIFEPRISAAVASCGFTTLRSDPHPHRWSHLTALLPALGYYMDDVSQIPFDWHEIVACLAPRSYCNWATLEDGIFPNTQNLQSIFYELKSVYGLYGAADFLQSHLVPGGHAFPADGRERAYQFLKESLPARSFHQLNEQNHIVVGHEEAQLHKQNCESIKALMLRDIGPVDPPALAIEIEILAEKSLEGYIEKKIRYCTAPDEAICAYLLFPQPLRKKNPAMIVFHQTTKDGKEEAVGHSGRASIHFGPELARRGYVVLAPDSICAGERIDAAGPFDTREFYCNYPTLSAMGKMIQDGRRAIDVLQSLAQVDSDRIGAIGHSLGAEEALFVAAFDERIQAAAASCGWAPFAAEANPDRWARDYWFSYIPRLRIDFRAGRLPAWDFDDVIRLIAPRGYFNYQTRHDEIFPQGGAAHDMTLSTQPLWSLFGAKENLRSLLEDGPHDMSDSAKVEIYPWLDRILR